MKLKNLSIKLRLRLKKLILDVKRIHLKDLRNVILLYLKKLPNIVHLKNLVLFNSILAIVVIVMFFQRFTALAPYYQKFSAASGGVYREGVVGNIEKINPLFVLNDAEDSANRLVYSGLTRVLPDNQIVPDLAEKWESKADTNTYDFYLKKGVKWHDGKPFTADDVIFTINLIQNPDTKTSRSIVWKGVKVEKINDYQIRFTLETPYPNFLAVVSEPILPKHLLSEVDPKNIKIAQFNQNPIGTGPYKFNRFDQSGNQTEVIFDENQDFAIHKPYLTEVRLKTYDDFDSLFNGLMRKQIDGISNIPSDKTEKIKSISNLNEYQLYLPRYQVLIFNLKSQLLATKELRQAIAEGVSRKDILGKFFNDRAMAVYTPILPGQPGYDPGLKKDAYDPAKANTDLDKLGWAKGPNGERTKDGKKLELHFVVGDNAENREVAKEIQSQLKVLGVKVNLEFVDLSLLQSDYIRPRNYDILLVGEEIGLKPDLYSFWDSSQISDPGLNLSGFSDRKVDKLLELARKSSDESYIADKLKQAQETLVAETPAIWLYNPSFTLAISKNIKGFKVGRMSDPVSHLDSIYDWYSNQKINF